MSQLRLGLSDNHIWIREMNRLRLGLKDPGIHNQEIMFIGMNRLTLGLIDAWNQVDEMSWLQSGLVALEVYRMNQLWLGPGNHLKVTIGMNQLWLGLGGYLEGVGKMNRLWLGLADLNNRTDWCKPKIRDQLGTVVKMSWLTPGLLSHLRIVSGMNQPWQSSTSCSGKTD